MDGGPPGHLTIRLRVHGGCKPPQTEANIGKWGCLCPTLVVLNKIIRYTSWPIPRLMTRILDDWYGKGKRCYPSMLMSGASTSLALSCYLFLLSQLYIPLLGTDLLSPWEGLGRRSHAISERTGNFAHPVELLFCAGILPMFSRTPKLVLLGKLRVLFPTFSAWDFEPTFSAWKIIITYVKPQSHHGF